MIKFCKNFTLGLVRNYFSKEQHLSVSTPKKRANFKGVIHACICLSGLQLALRSETPFGLNSNVIIGVITSMTAFQSMENKFKQNYFIEF